MADTNDFLAKLLQMNNQPPVPLMDPNADDEPKQEDFAPAQEADPISLGKMPQPDLAKRQEILNQYKSFRAPASTDESELESHLNKMDTNNNSRLDQEMASADFDQKAMTGTPEDVSVSSQSSPQAKTLSDFQRLKNAQESYANQLGNIAMLGGGNKIAQGFALGRGANIGDNAEGIKQLQEAAKVPSENIVQQMKLGGTDANDPASDVSKFARAQAYAYLKKVDKTTDYSGKLENMSAAQLEKIPGLKGAISAGRQGFTHVRDKLVNGHPMEQEPSSGLYYDGITGQPVKPTDVITDSTARKDPLDEVFKHILSNGPVYTGTPNGQVSPSGKTAPVKDPVTGETTEQKEYTLDDLNKSQIKNYDKIVVPTIKEVRENPTMTALNKLNQNASIMLAKLEPDPKTGKVDSGNLAAARAQFAQMASGGPATDSAMHEIQGAGGLLNEMQQALKKAEGEVTPQNIEFFKKAAYKFQNAAQQSAHDYSQTYVDGIKSAYPSLNLTDENVRKMLGIQNQMRNTNVEKAKANDADSAELVTVRGPSGQTVKMKKEAAKKYLDKPGYSLVGP